MHYLLAIKVLNFSWIYLR